MKWIDDWYNHVIKEKELIVRGFNSAGISKAVQNAENFYEKFEHPFRGWLFILVRLLVFFSKISLLKKKLFLFFSFSNLTKMSTVIIWTHVDKKLLLPF